MKPLKKNAGKVLDCENTHKDMKQKIPIKEIRLLWAEGKDPWTKERVFSSFGEADAYLRLAATRAPKAGGYDKHKIRLTWRDGEEYTGRWDVEYDGTDTNIKDHIVGWLDYLKNRDPERTDEQIKEVDEFLGKYALEDELREADYYAHLIIDLETEENNLYYDGDYCEALNVIVYNKIVCCDLVVCVAGEKQVYKNQEYDINVLQ